MGNYQREYPSKLLECGWKAEFTKHLKLGDFACFSPEVLPLVFISNNTARVQIPSHQFSLV